MATTQNISTRQLRRLRNRELILLAAQDLLLEKGLENLTINQIAQRAAYSKPAIYEYFDGIESILYEVSNHGFIQLGETLQSVSDKLPPDERLISYGHITLKFAAEKAELYKLMFTRVVPDPREKERRAATQTAYWLLVDTIKEGIEMGMFISPPGFGWKEMSYVTWTLIHGMANLKQTLMQELEFDLNHYYSEAFNFLIRSLKGQNSG